jgi:hypothetical protein
VGPVPLTVGMIASQCGLIAPTVWADRAHSVGENLAPKHVA